MSRRGLSPARLEAFSDGVVAVIITILVLELRVPEPNGLAGLRTVLPAVFLYLLTFVQIKSLRWIWKSHPCFKGLIQNALAIDPGDLNGNGQ